MYRSHALPRVRYAVSVKDPLIRLACIWPATLCAAGLVSLPPALGQVNHGVPLSYNAIAILAALVGALATIGKAPPVALLMLLCGSAYAQAPIVLAGLNSGPYVCVLAPAAASWVALEYPSPLREPGLRRFSLVLLAWCVIVGAIGTIQWQMVILPRPWSAFFAQAWELTLPAAAISLAMVAIRAAQPGQSGYRLAVSRSVIFLAVPAVLLVFALSARLSATTLAGFAVISMVAASGGMAWSRLMYSKLSDS